jgi:hypothetical protein
MVNFIFIGGIAGVSQRTRKQNGLGGVKDRELIIDAIMKPH